MSATALAGKPPKEARRPKTIPSNVRVDVAGRALKRAVNSWDIHRFPPAGMKDEEAMDYLGLSTVVHHHIREAYIDHLVNKGALETEVRGRDLDQLERDAYRALARAALLRSDNLSEDEYREDLIEDGWLRIARRRTEVAWPLTIKLARRFGLKKTTRSGKSEVTIAHFFDRLYVVEERKVKAKAG